VIFTIFQQGPPSLIVLTGFILAMVAIWLVSSGAGWKIFPSELLTPVMAGFAFGFFFICLHQAGKESVIFSLIAVRVVSITSLLTFVLITGRPTLPDRNSLGPIFMSGLLDTIGNGAYAIACQAGRLDIAVVLSSLYPASTVLLAWILLKEKITPRQLIGISAILISIILITN
jgi:drug/metabolite transporter (DMT)-like permease